MKHCFCGWSRYCLNRKDYLDRKRMHRTQWTTFIFSRRPSKEPIQKEFLEENMYKRATCRISCIMLLPACLCRAQAKILCGFFWKLHQRTMNYSRRQVNVFFFFSFVPWTKELECGLVSKYEAEWDMIPCRGGLIEKIPAFPSFMVRC